MAVFIRKHTRGGHGADVVLNCVAASETEGSTLLAARPQGTVLFCCNASTRLDNIANCPNDVSVVLNPGGAQPAQVRLTSYLPSPGADRLQVQSIFSLLRTEKQLHAILGAFVKKN